MIELYLAIALFGLGTFLNQNNKASNNNNTTNNNTYKPISST